MRIIEDPVEMARWAREAHREGRVVGLVPTMGFLHEGHLSLVRLARRRADRVVLSLFVNPTQFGPNEDFERYPRDVERDRALCEAEGVDVMFVPRTEEVYAPDHSVYVVEDRVSRGLCGAGRPGHFRGVLTVVAKLFNLALPDVAVFGEKDAQQLRLIRRMVRDLNFPVEIVGGPIVREADGVAMSSRNKNLDGASRAAAPRLSAGLAAVRDAFHGGERRVEALRAVLESALAEVGPGEVEYAEIVDDESLEPLTGEVVGPALVAVAVRFPGARLIDNTVLLGPQSP